MRLCNIKISGIKSTLVALDMELVRSIMRIGVCNPIVVYRFKGYYRIVEGRSRVRVCKYLKIEKIPATIIRKEVALVAKSLNGN